jgi:hypothetical protein
MLHSQFEAMVGCSNWTAPEKSVDLPAILQGWAIGILHSFPLEVMYKDIVEALEGCC